MSRRKPTKKHSKIITSILMLLIFSLVLGFMYNYTNGFTDDFATFYVSYNNTKIISKNTGLPLIANADNRFDVSYPLNKLPGINNKGYTVSIVSAIDYQYQTLDDREYYAFTIGSDFSDSFEITLYDTYFILNFDSAVTLRNILEKKHAKAVDIIEDKNITECFKILIYSYNEKNIIQITFSLYYIADSIELDREEIEVWIP